MSRLRDFYRRRARDTEGRRLEDVWLWDDDSLEGCHDLIQWLFPLPEPSQFNADAPLLTDEDIAEFQSDPTLRDNLRRSFERITAFLGLTVTAEGRMEEGPNFAARVPEVWSEPNHNWLRITRILRSLRLLGLEDLSGALYDRLASFYQSRRFPIDDVTFRYWTAAARGEPLPG